MVCRRMSPTQMSGTVTSLLPRKVMLETVSGIVILSQRDAQLLWWPTTQTSNGTEVVYIALIVLAMVNR
jgi:hypothetical protein